MRVWKTRIAEGSFLAYIGDDVFAFADELHAWMEELR
jgi:hypothetical protein